MVFSANNKLLTEMQELPQLQPKKTNGYENKETEDLYTESNPNTTFMKHLEDIGQKLMRSYIPNLCHEELHESRDNILV